MTNTNKIHFRSKFVKLIQQTNTEEQMLQKAFDEFMHFDENYALEILWRMTYDSCSPALWFILLDPQSISPEIYGALRNELRHQYMMQHTDFLSCDKVPDELLETFNTLCNQSDVIVANAVYHKCSECLRIKVSSKEFIELRRILHLLNNSKEKNFFGGLRSLGFNYDEAMYLKQFSRQIYNLFNVMVNDYIKTSSSAEEQPVENIEDVDVIFYDSQEESLDTSVVSKILTPENVLVHMDDFAPFALDNDMNALLHIGQLGFDLNVVIAQKEVITILLNAAKALCS